jgi:hypothetical protein
VCCGNRVTQSGRRAECTRDKKKMYSLHVIGLVGGVGVDILRHRADLPLLHDLRARKGNPCESATNSRPERRGDTIARGGGCRRRGRLAK